MGESSSIFSTFAVLRVLVHAFIQTVAYTFIQRYGHGWSSIPLFSSDLNLAIRAHGQVTSTCIFGISGVTK